MAQHDVPGTRCWRAIGCSFDGGHSGPCVVSDSSRKVVYYPNATFDQIMKWNGGHLPDILFTMDQVSQAQEATAVSPVEKIMDLETQLDALRGHLDLLESELVSANSQRDSARELASTRQKTIDNMADELNHQRGLVKILGERLDSRESEVIRLRPLASADERANQYAAKLRTLRAILGADDVTAAMGRRMWPGDDVNTLSGAIGYARTILKVRAGSDVEPPREG